MLRDQSQRWSQLADELEARAPRRQPIDAGKVGGATTMIGETRMTLPDGWHARLPANVAASSPFGSYEATYRQTGRDLILSHWIIGAHGVLSKDHAPELIAWLRAIAKDRVPFIVIDHTTPSTTTAAEARPSR